jgi:hypothetical protein
MITMDLHCPTQQPPPIICHTNPTGLQGPQEELSKGEEQLRTKKSGRIASQGNLASTQQMDYNPANADGQGARHEYPAIETPVKIEMCDTVLPLASLSWPQHCSWPAPPTSSTASTANEARTALNNLFTACHNLSWKETGKNAAQISQRGGPRNNKNNNKNKNTAPPAPATQGPYSERQQYRYCQIHAYNTSLGYPAINPTDVMDMANQTHNLIIQVTGKNQGINHHYSRGFCPGNFSTNLINIYVNTKRGPKYFLHSRHLPEYKPKFPTQTTEKYPRGIHMGSTKEEILQALGTIHNVILNFTTEGGYGHAACLRTHNHQWYLLDSENPGPINLDTTPTEQGWQKISGHTYILTEELPSEIELNRFDPYGDNYTDPYQTGTVPDTPPPCKQKRWSSKQVQSNPQKNTPRSHPTNTPLKW